MEDWLMRKTIKEEKAVADAEIEEYQRRQWKAYETSNQEQRKLLRALEDLKTSERTMYELDNNKDQVRSSSTNLLEIITPRSINNEVWQRKVLFSQGDLHLSSSPS